MASVAFANPNDAYVTLGTYCYLPSRPFWYRLALAWVPRYLILCTILGIYFAVFVYVRITIDHFRSGAGASSSFSSSGLPSKPTLGTYREGSRTHRIPMIPLRKLSLNLGANQASSTCTTHYEPTTPEHQADRQHRQVSDGPSDVRPPIWETYSFGHPVPIPTISSEEELKPNRPIDSQYAWRHPAPTIFDMLQERRVSWASPHQSRQDTVLQDAQTQPDALIHNTLRNPDISIASQINISGTGEKPGMVDNDVYRRHRTIKRQIRTLFIYPLMYLMTWIIPFINHCLQYHDSYALHPYFPLNCAGTTIVALQCAIDCWLFAYKEKPWRLIHGGSVGFWQSFQFWQPWIFRDGAILPAVERKSAVGVAAKNWWSQEDLVRDTGIREGSEDPMMAEDASTLAVELRRNVGTCKVGEQPHMVSGDVNIALVHRHTGNATRQLMVQEYPLEGELEV